MRQCKCKQCGRFFLEDDSNPNIHYGKPAVLCLHCNSFNGLKDGEVYQAADGEFYEKGTSEDQQRIDRLKAEIQRLHKALDDGLLIQKKVAELEALVNAQAAALVEMKASYEAALDHERRKCAEPKKLDVRAIFKGCNAPIDVCLRLAEMGRAKIEWSNKTKEG